MMVVSGPGIIFVCARAEFGTETPISKMKRLNRIKRFGMALLYGARFAVPLESPLPHLGRLLSLRLAQAGNHSTRVLRIDMSGLW